MSAPSAASPAASAEPRPRPAALPGGPLPRTALVLGKAAGAATRAVVQAVLLLVVVAIAGIGLRWRVTGVLGALVLLAVGTAVFACLSMTIASLVKERERFMGIGQLV